MKILIKQAKIIDRNSTHNGKIKDILIEGDKILKIGINLTDKANKIIACKNLHVSPGWIDMQANFCDPGYEHKETIETGANAAAAGGFTRVLLTPNTKPAINNKTQIEYIQSKSQYLPVHLHVCGTLSDKMEGEKLAEMYDMHMAGALAFGDYKNPVKAGLMSRALLYAKNFNGLIFSFPMDYSLAKHGIINEGEQAAKLGLKGIPELAEDIIVMRDIYLTEYNESKIHFSNISSKKSIKNIKQAKKKNTQVTAQIAAHLLYLNDTVLNEFNTHYKVIPPLRSEETRKQLVNAIQEGVIDCICSDHQPHDIEAKKVEFDMAEFGMATLENTFSLARTATLKHVELPTLIDCFTTNPAKILQLEKPAINENETAEITIFQPDEEFIFTQQMKHSKAYNNPFTGNKFTGKVKGIINKGTLVLNEE